ncbi:unnamed protein product [Brassica oleracea]
MLRICFLLQTLPRFQEENLDHNKILYDKVCAMSEKKGCTPAQLALAWVHHQGDDVCPIPGTTKIDNLNQNIGALSVKLTPEEMSELETIGQPESVKGERYTAMVPTFKNSDTPPLSSWKATVQKTVAKSKSKKKGKLNSQPSSPHIDIGDFVDGRDDEQIRAPVRRGRCDGEQVRAPLWRGRRDGKQVRAPVWRGRDDELNFEIYRFKYQFLSSY